MSLGAHLAALRARYDDTLLRPPVLAPVCPPAAAWQPLQAWCLAGAGPGGSPLHRPGALPALQCRFALAQWRGDGAVAEAWACALDGSARLAALPGTAARLALRLRTKRDDACWWRQRRDTDPWDAGHLIGDAASLQRLQQGFQPRRASLLMVGDLPPAALAAAIAALQQRSAGFRHPVRLLCLAEARLDEERLPAGLPLSRLSPPR